MDGELDLLLSVAGGLGRWQELNDLKRVYVKDADCLPCLKDLQRFLRRDDPDLREVFFKLGELQLIENDIVPLITTYPTDRDLVYHALKVLTFMTMPIDDMTAQVPKQYSILGGIKRSCLNKDLLAALMMLAAAPLNNHPRMSDEDHQTLQLLLTFFRNIVTIPDPPAAAGAAAAAMQARMQDTLLQLMFDESVMELISFAASHCDQRPFKDDAPLLLDLLTEVYAGVEIQEVLDITHEAVQQQQRQQQQRAQAAARRANSQRPKTVAQQLLASHQLTRHGRYKSTIVQKHADTAAVTYIHDVKKTHSLESPQMELETRVRPQVAQKWSPALLLAIKDYTQTLLKGGYNVLMSQLRRELECGVGLSRLEPGDFTKWFQLAAWFCGFVRRQQERLYEDKRQQQKQQKQQQQKDGTADPPAAAAAAADDDVSDASSPYGGVSATLGYETFKLTQDNFREQAGLPLRADQKNWSLLHASSLLLREALGVLELACKAGNDADKKAANRMARKLLHDTSELGLLPSLSNRIKTFSARFEPRSAAATLVEALHVVLRLYDRLQAQEDGVFFVKAKKRGGGGGRRKKVLDKPQDDDDEEEEEKAEDKVDQDGNKIDDKQQQKDDNYAQQQQRQSGERHQQEEQEPQQQGEQAASSQQQQEGSSSRSAADEQQQHEPDAAAMGTVAEAAAADSAGEETEKPAAAESGAAAEPAAGKAGEADSREKSQQQEQQQQPHMVADDSDDEESKGSAAAAAAAGTAAAAAAGPRRNMLEELEAEAGSDDEDDEDGYGGRYQEVALNLKARLRKEMAVPAVVHFYVWLLAGYNNWNSAALNHAVVSFLWRLILPEHLNLEPILYQMSVLRLFHQLLSDPSLRGKSEHTSVLRLATTVVRGLFSKLAPPPPPAAAAGGEQQQQADNAEEDDTQDPEKQQQAKEREQRRQAAVAGMVAVELLFWTHPDNCDVIAQEYYLKEGERLLVSGPTGKNKRKNAVGDDGLPVPRTLAPLLNPAGEKKLQTFFEKLCADRNNLELLTRQMGGRLSTQHIKQEMKRLGLKFGSLPDSLMAQLHQLWQHHRDQGVAAAVDKIAEELPGGWNAKQVRKLLRTEGLVGGGRGGRRRGDAGGDDEGDVSNDDGWDSGGEGGDVLFDVEKGDLERLYQQYIVEDDFLDKIAAALPFDAAANDVLATLRFHGIVSKPAAAKKRAAAAAGGSSRRRAAAGSDARKVTKAQLVELCEEHGSDGDGLNIIAMALGLPVLEVQKLLVKYNINTEADSEPEASTQPKRCPISTDTLQSLYDEFKDSGDSWLESIAEQLPEPATAKQVKAWLKKAGILKAAARKRRQRADGDSAAARPAAAAAAAGVSEVRRSSAVPEPQPMQLLGYLEALHRAYEDRWMDGPGAVQWLLDKLAAAENVWQVAAAATGSTAAADYALVPAGDDDLNFFCSDWSNELLMAAGVRNDNGDYFKIPGNSTAAWRERVRAALKEAQDKLSSSEAAAAYELVMEEAKAAAAAERETAAVAAAADEEARKFAAAQGLGFGSGSQRPAAAARGARAAAAAEEEEEEGVSKRRRRMTEKGKRLAKQKVAAVLESSDDGWDSDDAERKTQRRRQWQQRKSDSSSSSSGDGSDNDDHQDDAMPRFDDHDEDDDIDQEHDQKATSGSDHEDLDLAAAAGGGGGSGKKRRLPQKQQQQRKKPTARDDPDSDDDDDDDESPVKEDNKAAAAAVGAKGDSRKRRSSAGEAAAAGGSEQGKAKKRKSGAVAGDDAHETAARRTALKEITRKRQQQQQQQPQQQQKKVIRLVDDDDDDQADDESADDGFDDADENRPASTAAATAAAAKTQAAAAAGGRAGRGAMILLDDDDDDDD